MTTEPSSLVSPPSGYIQTSPYWDGLRERRLVLQICLDTGRFQHYPRPTSIFTGARNLGWREVSGRGRLAAWTQVDATGPFQQALVELDEGVRLVALVLSTSDVQSLRVGQQVVLTWPDDRPQPLGPIFTPVSD